jgi:hypothetical protein
MAGQDGDSKEFWSRRLISWGGLAFVYISAMAFLSIGFMLYYFQKREPLITSYYPELILFTVAIFTALLGVNLLRAAGIASIEPSLVVNSYEWEVLKDKVAEGKEDAITQYVRLRSLTGLTGIFTKLGIQGLPLATIALTLFFSLMFLYGAEYLDLAKLTLGAFIGSFVQKQVGDRQNTTSTVELPGGQQVKIRGTGPGTMA